jgi:hypothetical protein
MRRGTPAILILTATLTPLLFGGRALAQVDVSNSTVTCNSVLKGSLKFVPSFVNGGTATSVLVKVKGKLGGCFSSAPVTIPDGKSSFSGTLTLPSNDCATLLGPSTATGTITAKWKADQPITPSTSTITISSGDLLLNIFTTPWGSAHSWIGLGAASGGGPLAVSGAFTGGTGGTSSSLDAGPQQDIGMVLGQCALQGFKALNIGIGSLRLQ